MPARTHNGEVVTITTGAASILFPNAPDWAKRAIFTFMNASKIAVTFDSTTPVYGSRGLQWESGSIQPFEIVLEGTDLKLVKAIATGVDASIYVEYVG